MSLSLGKKLKIRTMIYVAGEPIPYFWPMRSFIHHNPLHALEHLPFDEAVKEGERLFHGRGYLPRTIYQDYLTQGKVDQTQLLVDVNHFLSTRNKISNIDAERCLMKLLTKTTQPVIQDFKIASISDVRAALNGELPATDVDVDMDKIIAGLREKLQGDCLIYEAVDNLYGTEISADLDELVIKSCLDFFDEGQSVWGMPERKRGFFCAWREVARRNAKLYLRGLDVNRILEANNSPEGIIARVMETLQIPEKNWVAYFTRELTRLHGWAGFIRWRASARHYFWSERYPADLVDLVAVRLTFALALLNERARKDFATTADEINDLIENHTRETFLRYELNSGVILPVFAQRVEQALATGNKKRIDKLFHKYVTHKRAHEASQQATRLCQLGSEVECNIDTLKNLTQEELTQLVNDFREFEKQEGYTWLRAMEAHAMTRLLNGVNLVPEPAREKRPFVQALFCIDTRSERMRRHLESVGDYQTFGIAGFFGIPVSFMELGKGSQSHLCPVLLTPKNLVLEMTVSPQDDINATTAIKKAVYELKESIFGPFVTVEAIGLLFGFDMFGKTLIPQSYDQWRKQLHKKKTPTHLLLDKLDREQADSILRAVQRAVIVQAVHLEFNLETEQVNDAMVRELREAALSKEGDVHEFKQTLNLNDEQVQSFINRLHEVYRINPAFARVQLEQLARIGFSLDEQVNFVSQALRSIGMTKEFSRFILLFGHGSTSDNNPYESALDCGACGGNHGLVNARVLAQMANKAEVRYRLRKQGIDIAEDAWFIPGLHNTTTDKLQLFDLDRIPSSHIVYIDRLRKGLLSASRLCAQERLPSLQIQSTPREPAAAYREIERNAVDWSQVRPEWGLSRNAYFIIGRRSLTRDLSLEGRAFLHSYDYHIDPKRRLLENILTGPLVVGQWINMEHYFSTVDNQRFGSGSKVYHNVAGRFGVMTGNLSDLRTGLPAQTVLKNGVPYHEPMRLITVIEAPLEHAKQAIEDVVTVKYLVYNSWIRLLVIDPEQEVVCSYENGGWITRPLSSLQKSVSPEEANTL